MKTYRHSCKAAAEAAIDYEGVPTIDEMVVLDCAEVPEQDLFLQLPVGCTL